MDLSYVVCFYLALASRNEAQTKLRTDGTDWKEGIYGMTNGRNLRTEKRGRKKEGGRETEEGSGKRKGKKVGQNDVKKRDNQQRGGSKRSEKGWK